MSEAARDVARAMLDEKMKDVDGKHLKGNGLAYHTAHEAYGVLLEEVRELEVEIFKKRAERDRRSMIEECIDIASVATRFAAQLIDAENESMRAAQ